MTTGTSILLLSFCVVSSASELIIKSENSTDDSPSAQELIIQSENSTDDINVYTGTCPQGWEQFDERCFKFISSARTWAEAERFCLLLGGNLASVHSLEEYYFIQGLIVTHTHGSPATWLGGSDAQQDGIWLWSDGSRFGFTHWSPTEPNNSGGSEQCLNMNHGGGLRWNDLRCSATLPSICAR